MTEKRDLVNLTVRVFLKNRFRYLGQCIEDNENFLTIFDFKSKRTILLAKSEISTLEALE